VLVTVLDVPGVGVGVRQEANNATGHHRRYACGIAHCGTRGVRTSSLSASLSASITVSIRVSVITQTSDRTHNYDGTGTIDSGAGGGSVLSTCPDRTGCIQLRHSIVNIRRAPLTATVAATSTC